MSQFGLSKQLSKFVLLNLLMRRNPAIWRRNIVVRDLDITSSEVILALPACNGSFQDIPSANAIRAIEVESGLLPMSVFSEWASTEPDFVLHASKNDVKPSNDSMDVVISLHSQRIFGGELQILHLDSVEIELNERVYG